MIMHASKFHELTGDMSKDHENETKPDVFRGTPVRYLGYANEVGEAFRAQVHVNVVRSSYGVASAYVVADAIHKGGQAAKKTWSSEEVKKKKVWWAIADTLIWQGLASVAIPGFTINRVCALSRYILTRTSSLSLPMQKVMVTSIGLACIPFIIKPIDRSVDYLLEHTVRHWYKGEVLETVVHHTRDDL